MSDARVAQLQAEIEAQQLRQKEFAAYPDAVAAAKLAETAAQSELDTLTGGKPAPAAESETAPVEAKKPKSRTSKTAGKE